MIRRYRRKPDAVVAIQWTGKNRQEIRDFVGEKLLDEDLWPSRIILPRLSGVANLNDYLVRGGDNQVRAVQAGAFNRAYEPAGSGPV